MNSNRGKIHEYLGIIFDFTVKAKVRISMDGYVEIMSNEFPMKISRSDTSLNSAGNNLFFYVTAKGWVKRNGRVKYFSRESNFCGQDCETGYSSNGRSVVK